MLEEWIRNVPVSTLRAIVGDRSMEGSHIWQLAVSELVLRQSQEALAA